jgi:uncharacterized protein YbcV (DUF1398 family)
MLNDAELETVLRDCTNGSDAERLSFPQVVGQLMAAGVERYRADLIRHEKTYYMPDGRSQVMNCALIPGEAALAFSAAGVDSAVRDIQAGRIAYREFCRRVMAAGCVDYIVSISGRRAVYFGRSGESHVEMFPGTK